MKNKAERIPQWLKKSLQGVTYWIGHRRCLYQDYPLGESALVAEICNLMFANLKKDLSLKCEIRYRDINKEHDQNNRERIDLVVYNKSGQGNEAVAFVFEVKRYSAGMNQILKDMARLSKLKAALPTIRTFQVVVSEASRPSQFVKEAGTSITKRQDLQDGSGYFKVRRTFKAAHAYTKRDRAQYAVLAEVFAV